MSKYCEYCSHSLNDDFNCLPCMHLESRPYADNTVILEDLFIASPSIIFAKGAPEWLKKGEAEVGMSIEDCAKILIAKEKCMERETSGTDTDCNLHNCDNCSLCYEQGTMGEQKEALKFAVDTMRKYQQLQADYENRLKADMMAMLTDMLIDVEEIASREQWCDYANDNCISRYDVEDLIQQKIKSLKGDLKQ